MQVALTAAQVTPKDQSYMIPTPEAAVVISDYDQMYPAVFKQRKGFIRHTGTIEDLLFMQSKYISDQSDIKFLNFKGLSDVSDKFAIFEHVMECFEDSANKFSEGIVSVDSSLERIRNDTKLNAILEKETTETELESWYTYWREKRRQNHCSLVPSLKYEDVGKVGSDPYVCFRRRELKQPRKTRRSDAQVMEKIKKINFDLETIRIMLNAGIKRDKYKKESFMLETGSFEKYWTLRTWQQEYGIDRPPTLPSFKAFHQQVPYFPGPDDIKKSLNNGNLLNQGGNKKRSMKKIETQSESESGAEENEEENSCGSTADLVKISIPPAAIKSVKYSRPYYPFEVVKQIQKDVETLLNEDLNGCRDFTSDLGSINRAREYLRTSRERYVNFRSNSMERLEMIRNRHLRDENVLVLRKGRCGRLLQSTTTLSTVSPVLNSVDFCLKERIYFPEALNHLRSIQARDCAHLNNAFVGNYNQHYIQCTSNLTAPTSLPSWISATSGLVQNTGSNKKSASNSNTSGSSNNGGGSPGKKKRSGEEAGHVDEPSKKAKTTGLSSTNSAKSNGSISTESTISSLTASPQFTVKVKSKLDSSSSDSSGVEDVSEELEPTSNESAPPKKSANAARFTPTGLQKESRLD